MHFQLGKRLEKCRRKSEALKNTTLREILKENLAENGAEINDSWIIDDLVAKIESWLLSAKEAAAEIWQKAKNLVADAWQATKDGFSKK